MARLVICLLVCVLLQMPKSGLTETPAVKPWCSIVDTLLVGRNISSVYTKTHKLCHLACLDTPGCESANYWLESKMCELNSVSHLNVSGHSTNLDHRKGVIYTFSGQIGCDPQLSTNNDGCHINGLNSHADSEWRQVFKGVAGNEVKLYKMWTAGSWNVSFEVGGSFRDNSLHQDWRNGLLNIRRVKLSLADDTGIRAELIFNGTQSDIMNWFSKDRLMSSPWQDLASATSNFFNMDGDDAEDRRFYINHSYSGCAIDYGWLVVVDSRSLHDCAWEEPSVTYPYPIILYSKLDGKAIWQDVLQTGGGKVGRANFLIIHIETE